MHASAVTLRNYRAIGPQGARLPLDREFLALIGVNNSGKSSLLRSFFELRTIWQNLPAFNSPGDLSALFSITGHSGVGAPLLQLGERILPSDNDAEPRIQIEFEETNALSAWSITNLTIIVHRTQTVSVEATLRDGQLLKELTGVQVVTAAADEQTGIEPTDGILAYAVNYDGSTVAFDWRALGKGLQSLRDAMYIGPFRNAINSGMAEHYDLEVGAGFISRYDTFKNGADHLSNEMISRMSSDLAEIFGLSSLEINVAQDKSGFVFLIGGRSFRGTELGAGIMEFLIVAANVLIKRPSILLIDEPELHLHASLQLRFLTLLAGATRGPVIFATHSLGLARAASDAVMVTFRDKDGRAALSEYNGTRNLAVTLGEMNYGGYVEASQKTVLLVEGASDVRTFSELLQKFQVRHQIIIVPLGGDGIATGNRDQELAEFRSLTDQVFAIVDSEREEEAGLPAPRRIKFKESCEKLGIECHILERRSIENYLDQAAARKLFRCTNAPEFKSHQKPSVDWNWDKDRNWRIAQATKKSVLDSTDLGIFIAKMALATEQIGRGAARGNEIP